MAFADIVAAVRAQVSTDCKTVTITDISTYGPCGNEDVNRAFVGCRSLLVENVCSGTFIDVGGTAQEVCFKIAGTIAAGQTFIITIDGCDYSYEVNDNNLVTTDEVWACVSFQMSGGTPGDTYSYVFSPFSPDTLTFLVGADDTLTTVNFVQSLNTKIGLLGYSAYMVATANGTTVKLCISPQWYLDTFSVDINTVLYSFSISCTLGTCTPPLLTFDPASKQFSGGLLPSSGINATNINNIYQGLYALLSVKGSCATNFTATLDLCSDTCPLKVTTLQKGIPFTYNANITAPVIPEGLTFTATETVENSCTMQLPVSFVDTKTIDYPGDTILCITLYLQDIDIPTVFKTAKICLALTCELECNRKTILLTELSDCCDKNICLPISTRLKNYIESIDNLVCQDDLGLACNQLQAANEMITTSPCKTC